MPEISVPGHEILNLIGEGGMAQVWAGARLGAGKSIKPVAVKVIRPEFSSDRRYREMFLSEGRTAMLFSHGNIVTVFDVGAINDQLYMVMEWVDGVTLHHFAQSIIKKRGRPLEIPVVLAIVTQILIALDYAHTYQLNRKKVGIVHRDVSPYNVMVTSSGQVKLLDFGIARVVGGRTTRSLKGNLLYMPREQAQGNPRPESDLYATGAVLFELLEGVPFRGHCKTEDDALHDIHEGGVPELQRADVPEDLRRLLREMLAVSWQDRPHSAAEVIKRIARLPIEHFSSLLPIKELYRAFFGESRSGLTRFAHEDPQMWVDHMRKMGKAGDGHRVATKRPGAVDASTPLRPRAHDAVRLHHVVDDDVEPFDASKTVRYDPGRTRRMEATAGVDATTEDGDTPEASVPGVERTVRLAWSPAPADEGPADEEPRGDAQVVSPTIRLPTSSFASLSATTVAAGSVAVARPDGVFTRLSWVSRTFGGGTLQGLARWRDLLAGPVGLLLLAALTVGVTFPLACQMSLARSGEVRR